jgi:Flp pilus assembly pilin Flp
MDAITRLTVLLSIATSDLRDRLRDDEGQASTEYAGILFVIVAIIAALIGLGFTDVGQAIKGKIVEAVGNIGG